MMFPKMTPVSVDETGKVSMRTEKCKRDKPTLDCCLNVDKVVRTNVLC